MRVRTMHSILWPMVFSCSALLVGCIELTAMEPHEGNEGGAAGQGGAGGQGGGAQPNCNDGLKNQDETGVDCGGDCGPCALDNDCVTPSDCMSGMCTDGKCASASCIDSTKNGSETDVDCGGPDCGPCSLGDACLITSDCTAGMCSGNVCVGISCNDMTKNGAESDVDCGGPDCGSCPVGSSCNSGADCKSGMCTNQTCTSGPVLIGSTVQKADNSFSMSIPNGTAAGDLLLLLVVHGGGSTTVSAAGWTEIENGGLPLDDPKLDAFYRIHNAGGSYVVTKTASDGSAILAAFRGATYGTKGSPSNGNADTIVTTKDGILLFVALHNDGQVVPGKPISFTSIAVGNGNGRSMRLSYSPIQHPPDTITIYALGGPGESQPTGAFAMALY